MKKQNHLVNGLPGLVSQELHEQAKAPGYWLGLNEESFGSLICSLPHLVKEKHVVHGLSPALFYLEKQKVGQREAQLRGGIPSLERSK